MRDRVSSCCCRSRWLLRPGERGADGAGGCVAMWGGGTGTRAVRTLGAAPPGLSRRRLRGARSGFVCGAMPGRCSLKKHGSSRHGSPSSPYGPPGAKEPGWGRGSAGAGAVLGAPCCQRRVLFDFLIS